MFTLELRLSVSFCSSNRPLIDMQMPVGQFSITLCLDQEGKKLIYKIQNILKGFCFVKSSKYFYTQLKSWSSSTRP